MVLGRKGQGTSMGRVKAVDDATRLLYIWIRAIGNGRLSALRGVPWHIIAGMNR